MSLSSPTLVASESSCSHPLASDALSSYTFAINPSSRATFDSGIIDHHANTHSRLPITADIGFDTTQIGAQFSEIQYTPTSQALGVGDAFNDPSDSLRPMSRSAPPSLSGLGSHHRPTPSRFLSPEGSTRRGEGRQAEHPPGASSSSLDRWMQGKDSPWSIYSTRRRLSHH
ncbi:hypothetical protein K469DRAFT_749123 [Zopfia rhizophila CBS 207.26]|uniref:Uncharacterized protein n=1 Tax=Zopfia rhizophila CBS 207.26 TaxID=1314779 RepID=A0A6A6EAZ6_9PEZI|nr:hypothetical protein K469DRAFT_749123 [Zopfia rhizophila CBS 207.26]